MKVLIPGDYIKFNDKLYVVTQDREGNPILQRVYLSSVEAFSESRIKLQEAIKKVNVSIDIPI